MRLCLSFVSLRYVPSASSVVIYKSDLGWTMWGFMGHVLEQYRMIILVKGAYFWTKRWVYTY